MTPRIITSEPAYRAPLSQADRIRMGRVQPMATRMGRHWRWDLAGGCVAMLVIVVAMVSL